MDFVVLARTHDGPSDLICIPKQCRAVLAQSNVYLAAPGSIEGGSTTCSKNTPKKGCRNWGCPSGKYAIVIPNGVRTGGRWVSLCLHWDALRPGGWGGSGEMLSK